VFYGTFNLYLFSPHGNQHKGGDDNDFKPHIKVENISRQKGTVQAHQKKMKNGIKPKPHQFVPDTAGSVLCHRESANGREQNHKYTEHIRHKRYPKRRFPPSPVHKLDAVILDKREQPDRYSQIHNTRKKAKHLLNSGFSPEKD